MNRVIYFFLLVCTSQLFAQTPAIEWNQNFGGSDFDATNSILSLEDDGFLILGDARSSDGDLQMNYGSQDYWLIRLDKEGNSLWNKSYGGSAYDSGKQIIYANDGGFILAGSTQSNDYDVSSNYGSSDIWLVKVNKEGEIIWEKNYGGPGNEEFSNIVPANDGGYLICGHTSSAGNDVSNTFGNGDAWIVKIDIEGDIEWERSFGGSFYDNATKILVEPNGNFAIVGLSCSPDGVIASSDEACDMFLIQLDASGSFIDALTFGSPGNDKAIDIVQTSEDGYLILGQSDAAGNEIPQNYGDEDVILLKLNANGEIKWVKNYGGSMIDFATQLMEIPNKGYLIVANSLSDDIDVTNEISGTFNGWLLMVDYEGKISWTQNIGGTAQDFLSQIIPTPDNGFLLTGRTSSSDGDVMNNQGFFDGWVIKLESIISSLDHLSIEEPQFTVFPSPSNGTFQIETSSNNAFLSIFDINGQEIQSAIINGTEHVNLNNAVSGTYFIQMKDDQGQLSTQKHIILKD